MYCDARGSSPFGKHAAGGANLDHISAVFNDLADFVLHAFHAVRRAIGFGVPFVRQQVLVAVASGDRERRAAGVDTRARNHAFIDGVAQRDIGIAAGAYIAHRGESGFQRDARILGADERFFGNRDSQLLVAKVRIESEMRVGINQSGQQRSVGQIDYMPACLIVGLRSAATGNAGDLVAVNYHGHVIEHLARLHVQHVTGMNHCMLRLRWLSGLLSKSDAGEKQGKEEEFQSFHKDGRIITGWRKSLRQRQER